MTKSLYPLLYQINTRVLLTDLSRILGRRATLDDIPDSELDNLTDFGVDWVWLLSVWQTGKAGQLVSRQNPEWMREFRETLPDLTEEDIEGSGFAITGYRVAENLGGAEALSRIRKRLSDRGMRLMLDFVPNHSALDHEWVNTHPEFYIRADEQALEKEPANYTRISLESGDIVLAHGRDPFFPGWPDTLQLNYGNPALQEAMAGELKKIAGLCDGVRCDMAMLVLPEVFKRTWGIECSPFWPEATRLAREANPEFCFMAEVYWDLEWTLLQQGFNYAYDKRLYDRLKEGAARPVREHFFAGLDYQGKMARFLENHDEPRVAAEFSSSKHKAAAIITFLSPGLRFIHQGQPEGRKKRISPHLVRAPEEIKDKELELFYSRLLGVLKRPVFKNGVWQLLDCTSAWDGNSSNDSFIAFAWNSSEDEKIIVVVNYSPDSSQCYINLPYHDIAEKSWLLQDLMSDVAYLRDGSGLSDKGLYLDEPGWKYYVFSLSSDQNSSSGLI
jgi:glycosidase